MVDMARKQIIPAGIEFSKMLAESMVAKNHVGINCDAEKKLAEIEEENAANKAPQIEIEPFKADIEFEKFLDLQV